MKLTENRALGNFREHAVKLDLTRRGFEVYMGDGFSSFDLVAYKDGQCTRVEVKGKAQDGKGPVISTVNADCRKYDILAVVKDDFSIRYRRSVFFLTEDSPARELSPWWALVKANETPDKNTRKDFAETGKALLAGFCCVHAQRTNGKKHNMSCVNYGGHL